jgi:signal transduction histidine kinase
LATTFLTFVIGWAMAGRSLRPLRRITARAKTLSERDLHEPIALSGPHDELRELADTFDEMLARLDRAFAGQRLFAANASHELRTPLTRIRTKLDVTLAKPDVTRSDLDEMGATIRGAIDRSAALIDSLLMLARTQGQIQHQAVAIDDIVRSVLDDLNEGVTRGRVSVTMSLAPCTVSGDPVLVEHLVRNVLDNAITHNVDDGWVDVETETNGSARFRVSNSGAVMSRSSTEALFLPLHRGDTDRTHALGAGSGLGLAIVKAVADAHRGWVIAEPLDEGGLAIEVALPAAEPLPAQRQGSLTDPRTAAGPKAL